MPSDAQGTGVSVWFIQSSMLVNAGGNVGSSGQNSARCRVCLNEGRYICCHQIQTPDASSPGYFVLSLL